MKRLRAVLIIAAFCVPLRVRGEQITLRLAPETFVGTQVDSDGVITLTKRVFKQGADGLLWAEGEGIYDPGRRKG